MIIGEKHTTIAYRCPECSKAVTSAVGAFALSGDLFKLKCPCGGSEMTVTYTGDRRVRLNVPCFICPKPHNFVISREAFFEKELFVIPCAYTGLDICFIGNPDKVTEAVLNSEKEIMRIMEEAGVPDFRVLRNTEDTITDPQIEDIVRFMLNELDEEGNITCLCKEIGEIPLYDFQILSERVRIFCEVCGAEITIPLNSVTDANEFINIDELHLT